MVLGALQLRLCYIYSPNRSQYMEKLITLKNPTIFFGQATTAYGILGPRPGMESGPPALEVQSLHHWTAREVPTSSHSEPKVCCVSSHSSFSGIYLQVYIRNM